VQSMLIKVAFKSSALCTTTMKGGDVLDNDGSVCANKCVKWTRYARHLHKR
jgi:hypothetical protein